MSHYMKASSIDKTEICGSIANIPHDTFFNYSFLQLDNFYIFNTEGPYNLKEIFRLLRNCSGEDEFDFLASKTAPFPFDAIVSLDDVEKLTIFNSKNDDLSNIDRFRINDKYGYGFRWKMIEPKTFENLLLFFSLLHKAETVDHYELVINQFFGEDANQKLDPDPDPELKHKNIDIVNYKVDFDRLINLDPEELSKFKEAKQKNIITLDNLDGYSSG